MADIMEECCTCHHEMISSGQLYLGRHQGSEMHRTKRMLKSGMVCTWKYQIREPELPDVSKPLNLWRIKKGKEFRVNLDVPVNRVFDCFNFHRPSVALLVLRLNVLCFFRDSVSGEDIISITFLSGGTGTPKLLRGARLLIDDTDIAVIVNTGEDLWYQGGHISPDIDTVLYLFGGILNTDTWWGITGDTFVTHDQLSSLGEDTYLAVGDRDRATELLRAELIRKGMSLTDATRELCRRLSVHTAVIPMTDQEYTTMIRTPEGIIHFQEYWVKHRGQVPILEVLRMPPYVPDAAKSALDAIRRSEMVIIGPSNPVTSILPILECKGIIEAIRQKPTVAVSPFIGDQPVSGPARELMIAKSLEPTSAGVYAAYADIIDLFIQDIRDPVEVPGALRCDTLMTGPEVARDIIDLILKKMR